MPWWNITQINGLTMYILADNYQHVLPQIQTLSWPDQICLLTLINIVFMLIFFDRFLFLKKIPTGRKLLSAIAVVLGLFICLIPTFSSQIDSEGKSHLGGATGVGRVLWPLAFMLGFVSTVTFI